MTDERRPEPDTEETGGGPAVSPWWRREWILVGASWLIGASVFFRRPIFSGFDRITGDSGDMRLIALLHEHWLDVMRGRAPWRSPKFFHPTPGVLGYSDTFALNEVFYAPLRAIGLDRYAALQGTLILLSLVGFLGCYLVCTRLIGAPRWLAIWLTAIGVFANALTIQLGHPQLLGVYWLPLLVLLVARVFRTTGRQQVLAAFLAGALFGAVLWSTYYMAWFALLATIIFTLAMAVQMRARLRRAGLRRLWELTFRPASAAIVGCGLLMIPFLLTYLPTLKASGGRPFSAALYYAPYPRDIVNVGDRNLLWGGWLQRLFSDRPKRLRNVELASAVTPMVMVFALACGGVALSRLRGNRTVSAAVSRSLVVLTCLLAVLPLKFGSFTLWRAVWAVVPGASGVRAIGRLQVLNAMVVPLAIASYLTALGIGRTRAAAAGWRRWVMVAGLLLLCLEQVNSIDSATVDRSDEVAFMASIPTPPAECGSFFIVPHSMRQQHEVAIDAMIVAQLTGVPTLNGYSGVSPPGWQLKTDSPDYLANVRVWIELHSLTGVCSYDETLRVWQVDPLGAG